MITVSELKKMEKSPIHLNNYFVIALDLYSGEIVRPVNMLDNHYADIMKSSANFHITEENFEDYKYNPRQVVKEYYGDNTTDLYFVFMYINNLRNYADLDMPMVLKMPKREFIEHLVSKS